MKIELASLLVTNIVVIAGWLVIYRQSMSVKDREDIRQNINLVSNTIEEIYALCCEYYSSQGSDHISYVSTKIKAKFVLLSHYLLLLREAGVSVGVSGALTAFKIHATGGHFETIDFHDQESVPNWKAELAASSQELRFRVEKAYFDWAKSETKLLRL